MSICAERSNRAAHPEPLKQRSPFTRNWQINLETVHERI